MMCIAEEDSGFVDTVTSRMNRSLVAAFAVVAVAIVAPFGVSAFLMCLLVPWLIFHWLFGIVTLQHHTHPRARWFKTLDDWSFYEGQVANTVHVVSRKLWS